MSDYRRYNGNKSQSRAMYVDAHGKIPPYYDVHHINGIKDDNRLENLIAIPRQFHKSLHEKMRREKRWISDRDEIKELMAEWKKSPNCIFKKILKRRTKRKPHFKLRVRKQMRTIR